MPNITAGQKIVQIQLESSKVEKLDEISGRTYVPRAMLLRMAIDNFLKDASEGRIQMGISLGGGSSSNAAPQPTFTTVPPPPSGDSK